MSAELPELREPRASPELETMVRALWDIEQVKQLKARYFRLLDTRAWADLRTLFTDDATFRSQGMRGVEGPDGFVQRVQELITPGTSVHHGHTPEIEITGDDTATGTWAMHDYLELDGRDDMRGLHGYGHYVHDLVRDPRRGWLISRWTLTRIRVDRF